MNFQKTFLLGNVIGEVKDGKFSVSVSKWMGGEEQQEFFNCVTLEKRRAEFVNEHVKRGTQVFIEGYNRTREWEKGGEKRQTTEIVVESIQLGK